MTELASALASLCPEIESGLKPHLRGLFRGLISGRLPQAWAFATEVESASLSVDQQGNASAYQGALANPDVSIRWDQARLLTALRTRDARKVPPGPPPRVQFHTAKGKEAYQFLRGRLGL